MKAENTASHSVNLISENGQPSSLFAGPHILTCSYMQDRSGWRLTHREIGPPEGFAYFMYILEWVGET